MVVGYQGFRKPPNISSWQSHGHDFCSFLSGRNDFFSEEFIFFREVETITLLGGENGSQ